MTTIPNLLYKFMPAVHAKSSICQKRLKISILSELNDPFEWVPAIIDGSGAPLKEAKEVRDKFHSQLEKKWGMICMSRTIEELLLWSHYGDSHKGMALAFSFPESSDVVKVEYTKERLSIDLQNGGELGPALHKAFKQLLGHKHEGWSYEQEYRFVVPVDKATKEDGHFWKELPEEYLSGVVLGCLCPVTEDDMKHFLLEHEFKTVAVSRAKMNPRNYTMCIQHSSYCKDGVDASPGSTEA